MFRRTMLVLSLMIVTPLGVSAQTIQSTFDAGLEGWTTSSGGSLTFSATNGNPGGYLQQVDLDLQDMFVMAPAPFLGNLTVFQGGNFSFDVKQIVGTADYAPFGIVIFRNGANFVSADIVPAGLPGPDWSTQSVVLNATSFGTTPDFLASILNNVTAIEIMLESQVGVIETVGLDNVQLAVAVPEPGSLVLLSVTGVGAWLTYRQRRFRKINTSRQDQGRFVMSRR